MFTGLRQHHIGCLVQNIADFRLENGNVWNDENYSQVYSISSQDVQVCFLQLSSDTCLELVQPGSSNGPLIKLLGKGITYYHIGFVTSEFDISLERLVSGNYKLLSVFDSEAFEGRRCAFLYHPQMRLLELIEANDDS
jgi:methylmalonyl-CoA/ethylmalonyl-CoA epimerase